MYPGLPPSKEHLNFGMFNHRKGHDPDFHPSSFKIRIIYESLAGIPKMYEEDVFGEFNDDSVEGVDQGPLDGIVVKKEFIRQRMNARTRRSKIYNFHDQFS